MGVVPEQAVAALMLAGGLILLFAGGEMIVRSASQLARALGLSPLWIGMVVVAFGTSSPELAVAIDGVLTDAPSIAVGNIIGSNIVNILLVLAVAAIIHPLTTNGFMVYRDGAVMLASMGLFMLLAWQSGSIGFNAGAVMVGGLVLYLIVSYLMERVRTEPGDVAKARVTAFLRSKSYATWFAFLTVILGLAALIGGAHLVVQGAVDMARAFKVDEAVISASVVAFGTSLPELAAVLIAAARREGDLIIGGIVGSNIFNILSVIGITALVQPVPVERVFVDFDMWVMLGAASIVTLMMLTRWRISRIEGLFLILCYALYIYVIYGGELPYVGALRAGIGE